MNSEFKLPTGRRELKIGDSLRNNGTSFHGIKYDFKPSNEECSESAIMEVTPTNQVSIKYPRGDSEASSDFMYSGTMKQFPKEYFLVVDHVTGEVTLERLTANIQLKRTKVANTANKNKNQNYKKQEIEKEYLAFPELNVASPTSKKKTKRKQKSKNSTVPDQQILNKKYSLIPQHSPLHPSPSRTSPESKNQSSSNDYKSTSSRILSEACGSQSNLNSVDDDESSMTGFESKFPTLPELLPQHENEFGLRVDQDLIGSNSDSSSDSSSDSDSNSDSSSSASSNSSKKVQSAHVNGYLNGCNAVKGQLLLKDDLRLSDSGSDSD